MHIVIFGVGGNIGRRLAVEALDRGREVTGVVRDPAGRPSPDPRVTIVGGDAMSVASVTEAGRGADMIISAISPRPSPHGQPSSLTVAARALIAGTKAARAKRLMIVGGAGSLEVRPGLLNMEQPGFPEIYKPEARAQAEALAVYRAEAGDIDWTYVSPAAEIGASEKVGRYRIGGDQLLVDAAGKSFISFADYAAAFIDEVDRHKYSRTRITFAY